MFNITGNKLIFFLLFFAVLRRAFSLPHLCNKIWDLFEIMNFGGSNHVMNIQTLSPSRCPLSELYPVCLLSHGVMTAEGDDRRPFQTSPFPLWSITHSDFNAASNYNMPQPAPSYFLVQKKMLLHKPSVHVQSVAHTRMHACKQTESLHSNAGANSI